MVVTSNSELEKRATSGASWAMIGFGGAQLIRFAGNLVLTRLVLPEAFGLAVLVNSVIMGLVLFSDVGIAPSVIQHKRGDERAFLDTAWTIQAIRGVILSIAAVIAGFVMAHTYDQPVLFPLVAAAGLGTLFSGAGSMQLVTANRNLFLKRLTSIDLAGQAIGFIVTVGWAAWSPTVWALVVGGVAAAFVKAALSWIVFPPPHGTFAFERAAAHDLVRFGKWIFVSTVLAFLAGQLDRFLFGKLFTLEQLGIYHLALQLSFVPAAALSHLGGNVVFPFFSRVVSNGGDLRDAYRRARAPMLLVGGWAVSALFAAGPALVHVLYPSAYDAAGVMLQIVTAGLWFGVVLEGPNGAALLARGMPRWTAAGSAAKLAGMALLLPLGMWAGRALIVPGGANGTSSEDAALLGALVGLSLAEVCRYALSLYAAVRLPVASLLQDVGVSARVAASAALGCGVAWLVAGNLSPLVVERALRLGLADEGAARVAAVVELGCVGIVVTATWARSLVNLARRGAGLGTG